MNGNRRLLYLDNIRLLVILLVVVVHAGMTYSGSGRWYTVRAL